MALFASIPNATAIGALIFWPTGASEPEMAWIPEPYELYGVAMDESGVVLPDGSPIRTFVDGAEYSNKTSVFSRPSMNDGYFQVETYGNFRTNRVSPGTPTIKEGADENESIMYVWGDMSNNTPVGGPSKPWLGGVVFSETHNWTTGAMDAGDLNAAPSVLQPPLIKIYSIVTQSQLGMHNDHVWLCNPTPDPVNGAQFYIQKDIPGDVNGPTVQVMGTIQPHSRLFVDLQSTTYFVETGDNVKLVWKNTPGPGAAFGGNDIIVDRVEFNATFGGTLYWEPGNTIQGDESAPLTGGSIERNVACDDTNSRVQDFFPGIERIVDNFPPLPPWPLTIDGLSSASIDSRMYHFTSLSNYQLGWTHLDPEGEPQAKAIVAISEGQNRTNVVWFLNITGTSQAAIYGGPPLLMCKDYWYSVNTSDGVRFGKLADIRFHTDCPPSSVTPTSPANGTIDLSAGQMTLYWAASTDPDPGDSINYTWQVATDVVFTAIHAQGTTLINSSSAFTTNPLSAYYWRVNASDGWQSIPFSGTWSFATTSLSAPTLTLQQPLGLEDWTGNTPHTVSFIIGDDKDTSLNVWINYSLDGGASGYPFPVYAGVKSVGLQSVTWILPDADSASARVGVTVQDSDRLEMSTLSGLFEIDSTPPAFLTIAPANGSIGVGFADPIRIEFTELVNRSSAESSFSIFPDTGGIGFAWTQIGPNRENLTIRHQPLSAGTEYAVTFGTMLRDLSDPGNSPGVSLSFRFTTKTIHVVITPPVAEATANSPVTSGDIVMLDGSRSTGNITIFTWTIADWDNRIIAVLAGEFANFTFEKEGTYIVTLTVTDGATGTSSQDTIVILVNARAGFDWLLLMLVSIAIISGCLIGGTEVGRVVLLMLLVAPAYKRKVKGEEDPETRGLIMGYIIGNPGDNYTDIKRNLMLNNGPLSWHLMKLLKSGQIKSRVDGSKKRYYPYNMPLPAENGGELHEIQRRLIKAVESDSGKPVKFLAEELGISSQLALYHLRKLSQRNLLTMERQGLQLRVFPRARPKA